MKIAVAKDELAKFVCFNIERGEVKERDEIRSAPGGREALLKQLVNLECDLLICGVIPKELENALTDGGVNVIKNICGNPDAVVKDYLSGDLLR